MSFACWAQCETAMPGSQMSARLDVLAAHIAAASYDIVCIQELFLWKLCCCEGSANFTSFRQQLHEAGLVYHTNPHESLVGVCCGQNAGVVVFSRFPIIETQTVGFRKTAERLNAKGFVVADVQLPNGIAANR